MNSNFIVDQVERLKSTNQQLSRLARTPRPGQKTYKNNPEYREKVKLLRKILGMGGFLEDKALKEIQPYFHPLIFMYMLAKVEVDGYFVEKLENVNDIYDKAYKYYDEFIDENNYESRLNDEHLCVKKNEFILWYICQTIDYLYGKDSDKYNDYFIYEKEYEVDECLGSTERMIAYDLNPVEFMFYMATTGMDDNLDGDQDKRSEQLDINKDYVRLVDNYVKETVKMELKKAERW